MASNGPGVVAPDRFPIRDPKSRPQKVGRIINPVGFPELGGLDGPGKWKKGNTMKVEAPTRVKAAHKSSE